MASSWALLKLRVKDGLSGRAVPARIHLKRPDGSCYLPPETQESRFDGKHAPPYVLPMHFHKNLHLCKQFHLQSTHLTSGEAEIPLPPGEWRLFVSRGHERVPALEAFAARPGETVAREVTLGSVEDLNRHGWYSGDMHVHFSRFEKRDDYVLARLMAAEDLHAINNMVYKHAGQVEAPQRKMGHAESHHHFHHHHQIVAGGEEFRDDDLYGHMIAAGISKVIEPISVGEKLGRRDSYPLFAQVCDWARQQGGIAGWAHGGALIKLHESLPVEAALGKLDFIESIQFNRFLGFYFWYRLLNCGLRLATTGGSDFPFNADLLAPWYPNLGLDRTYVPIGTRRPFTYEAYVDGIRKGRTVASNGPLLTLEVDGHGPGKTLRLKQSGRVHVLARAACAYPLERIELVVNGGVERIVEAKGGGRTLALETRLEVPRSAWVAARVRGRVEPAEYGGVAPWNLHAHTSPIYLWVGGRPVRQKADATAMADYVRLITEMYRKFSKFKKEEHRRQLFRNLGRAEAFYERLLRT